MARSSFESNPVALHVSSQRPMLLRRLARETHTECCFPGLRRNQSLLIFVMGVTSPSRHRPRSQQSPAPAGRQRLVDSGRVADAACANHRRLPRFRNHLGQSFPQSPMALHMSARLCALADQEVRAHIQRNARPLAAAHLHSKSRAR